MVTVFDLVTKYCTKKDRSNYPVFFDLLMLCFDTSEIAGTRAISLYIVFELRYNLFD